VPRDNELIDKFATPFDTVTVPIVLDPSLNTTLPVGVPPPGDTALTVALKVTVWPKFEGFSDEVSTIDVDAGLTTCVTAGEVLVPKLLSSLYTAVIAWFPTDNDEIARLAVPPASATVPIVVLPSLKVRLPVGVPTEGATGLTVPTKVIDWPNLEGFADGTTSVLLDA
jgi:hypothetical protein